MLEILGLDQKQQIGEDIMITHLRIANGDLMDPEDEEKILRKIKNGTLCQRRMGFLDTTQKIAELKKLEDERLKKIQ